MSNFFLYSICILLASIFLISCSSQCTRDSSANERKTKCNRRQGVVQKVIRNHVTSLRSRGEYYRLKPRPSRNRFETRNRCCCCCCCCSAAPFQAPLRTRSIPTAPSADRTHHHHHHSKSKPWRLEKFSEEDWRMWLLLRRRRRERHRRAAASVANGGAAGDDDPTTNETETVVPAWDEQLMAQVDALRVQMDALRADHDALRARFDEFTGALNL